MSLEQLEDLLCPNCLKWKLQHKSKNWIEEDDFYAYGTSQIFEDESLQQWKFCWMLKCNNKKCMLSTLLAGEWKVKEEIKEFLDDESGEHVLWSRLFNIFNIKYSHPSIHLIKIPESTPKLLTEIILESFTLFWIDTSSCWNKIRCVVERILDFNKVKKITKDRKKITLHCRIRDHLPPKLQKIWEKLLALKWIGNEGSHSDKISRENLEDAYKILEHILIKLFDTEEEEISIKVNKINKKKGV